MENLKRESGKWIITFGKYKNYCLKEVPTHYLEWVLENFKDLSVKELNVIRGTVSGRKGQIEKHRRK
jgi:uncharacterized protein (DUF3820 family)